MASNVLPDEYVIESVDGIAFAHGELKFMIKWEGYHENENTLEPSHHVWSNEVFQAFLSAQEDSYEEENASRDGEMEERLEEEASKILETHDAEQIVEVVKGFTQLDFRCLRAFSHHMHEFDGYAEKYERMYLQHMLLERTHAP